ncbi:hypothetical protein [Ramlibacter sp. PS4R-6]|uniref:hypothetical protein n=1 Tax=Ramlibacter sp. PS4R-6 TaxID=3133438 RepID=UPI00309E5F1B
MKTATDLTRRFALAAHELRQQLPPATLQAAIHRHLDRAEAAPPRRPWAAWLGWAGLSTAAATLAIALVVHSMLPADAQQPATTADADGFVRLVSADEWQRAQGDAARTWVVNTELPQARLAALGLPYDPARAGERVPAQLLMHSSGDVLAVRFNR